MMLALEVGQFGQACHRSVVPKDCGLGHYGMAMLGFVPTDLRIEEEQNMAAASRSRRTALAVAPALGSSGSIAAQYPDRPLRYIVPQAPGSASDTSARIIAAELTRILGQQIVVDNRPGGALTIGINMVVRAAPDGYTLGYGNIGGLAINRSMMKVPYDALKDIQPIAQTNSNGMPAEFGAFIGREVAKYEKDRPQDRRQGRMIGAAA
ncbi:MAG: hypothetical protein GEV05_02145 [Betaproteobacteria bacterium]|nr:hypothetical protein [Betaproteobacteria bacterium]